MQFKNLIINLCIRVVADPGKITLVVGFCYSPAPTPPFTISSFEMRIGVTASILYYHSVTPICISKDNLIASPAGYTGELYNALTSESCLQSSRLSGEAHITLLGEFKSLIIVAAGVFKC